MGYNSEVKLAYQIWESFTSLAYGKIYGNAKELYFSQIYLTILSSLISWGTLSKGKFSIKNFNSQIKKSY